MTTSAKHILALVTLLIFSAQPMRSAPVSGTVSFSFDSATTALFDLTGTYDLDQQIVGTGGATVDLHIYAIQIAQDGLGRLRGKGVIMVSIDDNFIAADYTARGSISGGGSGPTRVSLQVHLSGNDVIAGFANGFVIPIQYNLEIVEGALTGTARGSAHFSRLQGGTINSSISVALPAGMDGSWSIALDILPLNSLTGSGLITLSNGRMLQGHVDGAFLSGTGESSLHFRGALDQTTLRPFAVALPDNHLNLVISPNASKADQVNGQLLGQTVMEQSSITVGGN